MKMLSFPVILFILAALCAVYTGKEGKWIGMTCWLGCMATTVFMVIRQKYLKVKSQKEAIREQKIWAGQIE